MVWIYDEWLASNPRQGAIVVEVGVALGKSLAYLCDRLDAAGRDDVQVFAVDPWSGTHRNGEQQVHADEAGGDFTLYARMMLENAPKAFERVRVLRVSDVEATLFFEDQQIDLLVLDAEHTYEAVILQLCTFRARAHWIGGDDFVPDYPGVERAVRQVFGDDFEYRARGGPHDDPEQYEWGTWLRRGR